MNQYLRIAHKGRGVNVKLELPDHTIIQIPVGELSLWECVGEEDKEKIESIKREAEDKAKKKEEKAKPKKEKSVRYRASTFRRNTNGLGLDHPYESVDMCAGSVEFCEGIEAPF